MELIHALSTLSGILAIWIGVNIRSFIWYYVTLSFICDALIYIVHPLNYFAWNGNTFLLGEFILVSLYLIQQTITQSDAKKTIIGVVVIISVLFILTVSKPGNTPATIHGWFGINYKGGAILNGLLIPGTLFGFYRLLHSKQPYQIERSPLFIFCAGFLLYVAGSFMMMLFEPHLKATNALFMNRLWAVHNLLNIVKNLSIAYCLHLYKTNRR